MDASEIPRVPRWARAPSPYSCPPPDQRARWSVVPRVETRTADVLIAGGGLSGVAAAVAAARRGLSVTVIEPTHMIGGQATAAGVSAFDITSLYDETLNDHGIWGEIVERTLAIYRDELERPANVGHYRNASLTPNVVIVERVLSEMLEEAGVTVLRSTRIISTLGSSDRLTGLRTSAGEVHGSIVIDATEDGQVLALSAVPHRIGNVRVDASSPGSDDVVESKIQSITSAAVIRHYPDGVPDELMIRTPPEGWSEIAAMLLRAFPPAGAKDAQPSSKDGPLGVAGYRAAPDLSKRTAHNGAQWQLVTRTSLNHFNDTVVTSRYLTDPDTRLRDEARAMLRTLCVLHHLQNVLGLDWSVTTDEGFAAGPDERSNPYLPAEYRALECHFPLIPYIRESRRLIGTQTLTGAMITRGRMGDCAPWNEDSIATGTYHPDLHGARDVEDFEADLGETLEDKPNRLTFGPFPIPLGCLIPASMEGLLAAEKNISASRLASSATRVHPTVTSIGEAAGVLAALAVRGGMSPRDVPVASVQHELASGGALISPVRIEGIPRDHEDYPLVALAVARRLVPTQVVLEPRTEQYVSVDRRAAVVAAAALLETLDPLSQAPVPVRQPAESPSIIEGVPTG